MKNEAVWNSTLDGSYEVAVTRTGPYQANWQFRPVTG